MLTLLIPAPPHAESACIVTPAPLVLRPTVVLAATADGLPYASCDWTVTAFEHWFKTTDCVVPMMATLEAAAAVTVCCWVTVVKPVADAVTSTGPALRPWRYTLALLVPAAMVAVVVEPAPHPAAA